MPERTTFIKDRTTEQTYPNGTWTAQIRAQTAPLNRYTNQSPRILHEYSALPLDSACASDAALLDMELGDTPVFRVGDWVEVMRLDGNDVRHGEVVACWAQRSPVERCGFETWYRVNFGSDSLRCEMDVPDTEIIDALPL